jgi:proton-translocating NADH-quinone oxidoreductase chain M
MTFLIKNKILFLNVFNIIGFISLFLFFFSFSLGSLNNLVGLFLSFIFDSTNFFFFFSIFLLFLGFFKIIMVEHHKVFEIKKFSIFFCMNLMSFFFFYFMKVSKLYSSFFFIYSFTWFGNIINIEYNLGIDSLSLIFIFLTLFLIPICLIISWNSIYYNTKYFFLLFLILEILLINVFCAIDLMLFYIAFESILIPMYFLIGYWGSRERRMHAAFQFFLYTLGGSLLMLAALIFCQLNFGSTNLHFLTNIVFSPYRELVIWLCFFVAFAVKIPMMPVHIWLPEAHVESATGGSVALAGILLKLGTYGILRFLIPLLPFGSVFFTPLVYLISFFGVFYASLTTLRQIDLKKIIAYSSVIHMNYLMFGLFAFNLEGLIGSLILMVAHGFVSGGLFVCVGILYDRYHTRLQKPYGGLNYFMPVFSFFFLIFTLANISFPGSINFIGEFLVLLGIFMKNIIIGMLVMFMMIFSTCYALWLYNKIFSGLLIQSVFISKTKLNGILFNSLKFKRLFMMNFTDINIRELFSLLYLIIPVIYLGLNPSDLIDRIELYFLFSLTTQV